MNHAAEGGAIAAWQAALNERWSGVRVERVSVESDTQLHAFEVRVELAGLDPSAVRVELFADGASEDAARAKPVACELFRTDASVQVYRATTDTVRPASDYTARVIPAREGVEVPLETNWIHWQARAGGAA